jgi:diguanylate cyclase (GGDEF)-like protein
MNIYVSIAWAVVALYIPLFIILIINRSWQKQQKLFLFYLIAALAWGLSTSLLRSDLFMEEKLFLFRVANLSFMLMVVQLYYFIRFTTQRSAGLLTLFGYASVIAFATLAGLGYISPDLIVSGGIVDVAFGWWLIFFAVPPLILSVSILYSLGRRSAILTDPRERNLNTYLLLAVAILTIFYLGFLTPIGDEFPISHLGNLIAASILIYAIVRHRLVDIRVTLRRSLVWVVLGISGTAVYVSLLFLFHLLFGFELNSPPLAMGLGGAIGAAVATYLLRGILFKKMEQVFYGETYDSRQALNRLVRQIHNISGLEESSTELLPLINKALKAKVVYLLFPEAESGDFVTRFVSPQKESNPSELRLKADNPIPEWMRKEGELLPQEKLDILPQFRGLWGEERESIRAAEVEMFVPLLSRGELAGILVLGEKQSGRYSLGDIDLIESIAKQVSTSLEKEYLYERLQLQERELELINRLTKIITSRLDIREVYEGFAHELKRAVDVDWATIALIDDEELYFMALSTGIGSAWQTGQRIMLKGTATEWVAIRKEGLVEPDLAQGRRFWTGEYDVKQGIRSIAYLPLVVRDRAIGSLNIASRRPNAYTRQQIRFLEQVALQIATPIENARLYAATEEKTRIDGLTGLFNRRHLDERLEQEIGRGSRHGGAFSLIILDLDHFKVFDDAYGHVAGDELLQQIAGSIKSAIRGMDEAFRYGGDEFAVILPQTSIDDAFMVAERVRERIATEMKEKQILLTASLGLAGWPSDGVAARELINAADVALYYSKRTGGNRSYRPSQALPSLDKPAETSRLDGELESLSTIHALALAVDTRDHYTYGHSRRVNEYAVSLARALGLPSAEVTKLSITALLHDIGKIGITDKILNKPSKLNLEEWEEIKTHPQLGANIVTNIPSLVSCLPGILYHHERYDGSGYPKGLEGEAIPLEARILSIADAFAAMTSDRSYREAFSSREAMEQIKSSAGTHFDPKLVEVFCETIEPALSGKSGDEGAT